MKLAGIEPDGFVAPHTPTRRLCGRHSAGAFAGGRSSFGSAPPPTGDRGREPLAPAWSLTPSTSFGRLLAPGVIRACALVPKMALRLDVHPSDLEHPRHMMALERVLERCAAGRTAVTYQDLAER